jgi:hypothetical protein
MALSSASALGTHVIDYGLNLLLGHRFDIRGLKHAHDFEQAPTRITPKGFLEKEANGFAREESRTLRAPRDLIRKRELQFQRSHVQSPFGRIHLWGCAACHSSSHKYTLARAKFPLAPPLRQPPLGGGLPSGLASLLPFRDALSPTPANDSEIKTAVDIVGTASDAHLAQWTLSFAPANTGNFTQIATGSTSGVNGVLGRFDPTVLANGIYDVLLTVFGANGTQSFDQSTCPVRASDELIRLSTRTVFSKSRIPCSAIEQLHSS